MEFIQITDIQQAQFKAALDIYEYAFPANERHPLEVITARVAAGHNQLYIAHNANEVIFMALLWPLRNTRFILLDYMATSAASRGQNIGSRFLQHLQAIAREQDKYYIIEAEHPGYGDNKEERQRRIAFYKKNGAKELKNVRYILPALQGDTTTEMILMILPDYPGGKIDVMIVNNLIHQLYKELYNRNAADIGPQTHNANEQIELI
ncbi:MAG: GNAT family N-acetyltransferase [Niastella sp.]|nr:GNAT family N-acetyltransferase [Niastella sp.]